MCEVRASQTIANDPAFSLGDVRAASGGEDAEGVNAPEFRSSGPKAKLPSGSEEAPHLLAKAAVTYHRVSTRDQNPELARLELRRVAELRGLHLVEEIEETGSGGREDRPGLIRVLELVRRGSVAWVLVWKLDRFGRSSIDVQTNVRELERRGVTFVATTQGLEVGPGAGPMARVVMTVLAAVAELERENISERTLLGLDAARRKGRKLGRAKGSKDKRRRVRRWFRRPATQ
jgi:DNA invertase Pin-like site-specific DNA recombinase